MDTFKKTPKIVQSASCRNQIKGTSISYLKDSQLCYFFTFFEMFTEENNVTDILFPMQYHDFLK